MIGLVLSRGKAAQIGSRNFQKYCQSRHGTIPPYVFKVKTEDEGRGAGAGNSALTALDGFLAGRSPDPAVNAALPAVYDELRQLAASYLRRERTDHTLQPTALVHESYLRLLNQKSVDWSNRLEFLSIAARMMRRILTDHAVSRKAEKRGGGAPKVQLDAA